MLTIHYAVVCGIEQELLHALEVCVDSFITLAKHLNFFYGSNRGKWGFFTPL